MLQLSSFFFVRIQINGQHCNETDTEGCTMMDQWTGFIIGGTVGWLTYFTLIEIFSGSL